MNSILKCLVIALITSVGQSQAKCHLKELDFCAASLMVQLQSQETPTTEAGVDTYCKTIADANECAANYTSKCATPLQRELVQFFSVGGVSVIGDFCTPGTPLRTKYLANADCLAEAKREAKRCAKDLQVGLETVLTSSWEQRLPLGCCAFNRYQDCSLAIIKSRCGADVVDLGRKVLSLATSRVPETVCQSFSTKSLLCINILPATGETPKGNKSTSLVARLMASFIGN